MSQVKSSKPQIDTVVLKYINQRKGYDKYIKDSIENQTLKVIFDLLTKISYAMFGIAAFTIISNGDIGRYKDYLHKEKKNGLIFFMVLLGVLIAVLQREIKQKNDISAVVKKCCNFATDIMRGTLYCLLLIFIGGFIYQNKQYDFWENTAFYIFCIAFALFIARKIVKWYYYFGEGQHILTPWDNNDINTQQGLSEIANFLDFYLQEKIQKPKNLDQEKQLGRLRHEGIEDNKIMVESQQKQWDQLNQMMERSLNNQKKLINQEQQIKQNDSNYQQLIQNNRGNYERMIEGKENIKNKQITFKDKVKFDEQSNNISQNDLNKRENGIQIIQSDKNDKNKQKLFPESKKQDVEQINEKRQEEVNLLTEQTQEKFKKEQKEPIPLKEQKESMPLEEQKKPMPFKEQKETISLKEQKEFIPLKEQKESIPLKGQKEQKFQPEQILQVQQSQHILHPFTDFSTTSTQPFSNIKLNAQGLQSDPIKQQNLPSATNLYHLSQESINEKINEIQNAKKQILE